MHRKPIKTRMPVTPESAMNVAGIPAHEKMTEKHDTKRDNGKAKLRKGAK